MKKKWIALVVVCISLITMVVYIMQRSAADARRNTDILMEKFMRTNKELQETINKADSPKVQLDSLQEKYK